jgi:hypothetical protein
MAEKITYVSFQRNNGQVACFKTPDATTDQEAVAAAWKHMTPGHDPSQWSYRIKICWVEYGVNGSSHWLTKDTHAERICVADVDLNVDGGRAYRV